MTAFNKLLVANFKQFMRDKTAVFFTFAFPLIFIFLFGMVFGGDNMVNYNIGVVRQDDSTTAVHISEALHNVPIFTITEGDLDTTLDSLKSGDLAAVVVIPAGLDDAIGSGTAAAVTLYHDPSQTTTSQVIIPVLRQLVDEFNRQITQAPVVLTLAEESILAANLSFIDFFVPGILALSIMQSGLFGVLPLVEWREKKVLKRLGVTPLTRGVVVASQLIFRLGIAVIQAAIIIGVAYAVFGVPVLGNWFLLVGLVMLGTLLFIALGYVVGARVKTVEGATPIVNLISFPMMFLSGIFWPVEMMPDFIRPVITAMPLTYLGDAFRQVMVNSPPLYSMGIDIAVMVAWLAACMFLTVRFFKWE
ncbi:ABC transporter permease [Dehalogenimonas sp. 4OHTPN]|uniref:ABC transporter permease n=1 Tax=Dehalogenimonas sp. 4OHTPN TaxID=3166643 RepID=A0AAU8G7H7_9CHLR